MRLRLLAALCAGVVLSPSIAISKQKYVQTGVPRAFKDLDAEVKKLIKKDSKDPATKRFDHLMTYLGLAASCPAADCHAITGAQWVTANLDADTDDEKVLAITTVGDGKCPSARLHVFVFDAKEKNFVVSDRTELHLTGAAKPTLQVTAAHVHDGKVKDLVLRADGQCDGGKREHEVRIESFAGGRLSTLVNSADHTTELVSHALIGAAPAAIELTDSKGKTARLWYDADSEGYDALRPYTEVIQKSISKDDDVTLSPKECAAPLGSTLATECHLEGNAKLQVAVQHGKAIGATVTITPASAETNRCIRAKLASETWKDVAAVSGCVRTFAVK